MNWAQVITCTKCLKYNNISMNVYYENIVMNYMIYTVKWN